MVFTSERIVTAIGEIQRQLFNELPGKLENAVSGMRVVVESTLTAAQSARDSAAAAHARVDAIHSELQALRDDVRQQPPKADHGSTRLLAEFASLRAAVEGWRAEAAALRADGPGRPEAATAEPAPAPTQPLPEQADPDPGDFEQLLTLAARIAYAQLTCHRDHWDFLVTQSSHGQHFRLPAGVKEANGLIQAEISGRTLIATLDALRTTQHDPAARLGTRKFAGAIYERIGTALRKVDTDQADAHHHPGNDCPPVTRIIIDDRPPADAA
ncbi:hypothetical protein [Streptomyces chattanoogensis]|uniref:hypothetical protein n=1 Tax=Streptomyces chattanoogensis TaxID=66876 RepID=UPI000AA4984B|nr:hypothetical protein [Streptomyces chattanoogensis]